MTTSVDAYDFGRYLQELRRAKEIPLEAVSQVTKIRLIVLQQIENEDLKALPTPTITKGFIRAFADAVGADRDEALNRYAAALRVQAPKIQAQATEQALPGPVHVWRNLLLAILLIILLIALSLYLFNLPERNGSSVPEVMPTPVETPQEPAAEQAAPTPAPEVTGAAEEGENAAAPAGTTAPQTENMETSKAAAQEDAGQAASPETEPEGMAPDHGGMPAPASAAPAEEANETPLTEESVPRPAEGKKVLEVTAIDLTWLKITTDGADAREMMIQPGEHVTLEAQHQFQLVIGNAAGVQLKLDGQPVNVPGRSGKVVHLTLP